MVLREKHPALREPPSLGSSTGAFEPYPTLPTAVPVTITPDDVEAIASRLSGAAGPGGTDSVELANWLLRFGNESAAFHEEMAEWTNWLANSHPPWAAYRATMANRLVALDKEPGTRPVGIGESYRRLWAKCLLKAIGSQATAACSNYNLCAGLQAGIEGAVHAVRAVYTDPSCIPEAAPTTATPMPPEPPAQDGELTPPSPTHPNPPPATFEHPQGGGGAEATGATTDATDSEAAVPRPTPSELGDMTMDEALTAIAAEAGLTEPEANAILLVDAANGFNELGRKAMLWTVRHRWANGARFAFNCYRHSAQLIMRRRGQDCTIILSREGVTQGDPLSMILYGLSLTPLSEALRAAVPEVVQPWYADDVAMAGPVTGIAKAQRLLNLWGPQRGYYPEPEKSVLIRRPSDPPDALEPVQEFNFQLVDGHRYVGGFVGTEATEEAWLAPQIQQWVGSVHSLAKVAKRFPQTAYAGLAKSLQSEWHFLQRVTPDWEEQFAPLEEAIATRFLPALLDTTVEEVAGLRDLLALPVRLGGLGIPDPTKTGGQCLSSSMRSTSLLMSSLIDGTPLCAAAHRSAASRGRRAVRLEHQEKQKESLDSILAGARPSDKRRIERSAATGAWLTTMPSVLNGTDLSGDEFRDSLRLRFGLVPTDLPHRCDGCGDRFTTAHAMSCRKGGLILLRHNDVAAEWGQLCGQALTPSAVTDEPLIQTSRDVRQDGATHTAPSPELRGDIAVHGFWRRGTTAIFDIRVTDTDAPSSRNTAPSQILQRHEKEKKDKYNDLCLARRRHFTPLVFSVDGLMGCEAKAASQRLASQLAGKWKRSYSEVCGYVRSRLSVALVRSANRCLRAERSSILRPRMAPWESGSGLGLYR